MRQRHALLLVLGMLAAGGSLALAHARPGGAAARSAPEALPPETSAVASTATGGALTAGIELLEGVGKPEGRSRTSRLILPRRPALATRAEGSDRWYLGMAGVALLLAVAGGAALAARRFTPATATGALQILSRVSLSPKHTVYMLRAGGRVLLVGTGPQGAPALISELDEIAPVVPAAGQGDAL